MKKVFFFLALSVLATGFAFAGGSDPVLNTPNGGTLTLGKPYNITWSYSGTKHIKLVLYQNGTKVEKIAPDILPSIHSYTWTVGNLANGTKVNPGTGFKVRVRTIDDGPYDESDSVFTIEAAGQPDLTPVVTYAPVKFAKGDKVAISIRVNNIGTAPSAACDMILLKDQSMWAPFNVPVIEAGGKWDTVYTWYASCDAALEIRVDSNNANLESNEGNNTWSKKLFCSKGVTFGIGQSKIFTEKAKPDLKVQINAIQSTLKMGSPAKRVIIYVQVENIGPADSAFCELVLKNGNTVLETIKIGAMHKGNVVPRTLTAIAKCGDRLSVQVDSDNQNNESNEENNFASKTIVCLGVPQ
jgi:hypothetical protein